MARGRLTLRQLQVLHRHGDRSPLSNVFLGSSDSVVAEEALRWDTRLPSSVVLASLGDRYRLEDLQPTKTAMQNRPFGCLTDTGILQMKARGEQLASFCLAQKFPLEQLTNADVQVYCNAFIRTQLSVQALLTGMLAEQDHLVPPVHVLPLDRDMIHTYSMYPEIAQLKIELEKQSESMKHREHEKDKLKQELLAALPAFRKGGVPFLWTTCGDYFYCREAHDVPYIAGTKPLSEQTVGHMSYRFHQFYQNRKIRSLVAGHLMDHAMKEMQKLVSGHRDAKKLVVYSGHDVSILAILHAMDADINRSESYWPPYSSALSLELLEDTDNSKWFVRVRINGEVATLRQLPDTVELAGFEDIVHDQIDFTHLP